MSYKRKFILRLEDVDATYALTNKAILELMENTSDEDSARTKDDIRSLNAQGLSWVIVEWNLEVYSRPEYREEVTVCTWPREINSRYVWRDFEMFCRGQKIAAASSKWMIVDLKSKTIIRLGAERLSKYTISARAALSSQSRKRLSVLEGYDISRQAIIRQADMDLNSHMHNSTYLDLIKEVSQFDARAVRIIFHREVKIGDEIFVKMKAQNNWQSIAITNADNDAYTLVEQRIQ